MVRTGQFSTLHFVASRIAAQIHPAPTGSGGERLNSKLCTPSAHSIVV